MCLDLSELHQNHFGCLFFWGGGEHLFIFCQSDPVSFHKIKEVWAFLAAVGPREENRAPGIGINSLYSELIGKRELRGIVLLGQMGNKKQGGPWMLLAMKNYRTLCKVTAVPVSRPDSSVGTAVAMGWGFSRVHWDRWDLGVRFRVLSSSPPAFNILAL